MYDEMELKRFMAGKIAEGVSLSDLQSMVNEKFQEKMTFMDIRILAAELDGVDWKALDPEKPAEKKEEPPVPAEEPADAPAGGTRVEESSIARPGCIASGTVAFGSGASAEWLVDNMGRLGLDKVQGKPTEQDYQELQQELRKLFER